MKYKILVNSSKNAFNTWKYKNNKEKSKVLKLYLIFYWKKKNFCLMRKNLIQASLIKQAISEIEYCYKLWKHASEIVLNVKDKFIKINKNFL